MGGRRRARSGGAPDRERLSYLGLGLASEAGEVADHLKELLRDGAWRPGEVAEELGDLACYWAAMYAASGGRPATCWRPAARRSRRGSPPRRTRRARHRRE
jgi:NTP pyrophosphatase (non-canonical NTP hydrolase)